MSGGGLGAVMGAFGFAGRSLTRILIDQGKKALPMMGSRRSLRIIAGAIALALLPCFASAAPLRDDGRSAAAWSADSSWTIRKAPGGRSRYTVDAAHETFAWRRAWSPGASWSISLRLDLEALRENGGETGGAGIAFARGAGDSGPVLLATVSRHGFGATLVEVQYYEDGWRRVLSSGWLPGKDTAYRMTLARKPGDVSLRVSLHGNRGLAYAACSASVPVTLLDGLGRFGLRAVGAKATFVSVALEAPGVTPEYYQTVARAAVRDLLRHFWRGGSATGRVAATWNGYPSRDLPDRRGSIWERGTLLRVLDNLYQTTGDADLRERIATDWHSIKTHYTAKELQTAGTSVNPACDDCGWNALTLLMIHRVTNDPPALQDAKGLVDSAFHRWLDDQLGGGMWYSNDRRTKSLYQVGIVLAALEVSRLTGERSFRDRAMACYDWMEAHLLRPDGLYWCDRDGHGPVGADRPDDIHQAGSVTFLAGDMGMTVLQARLYRTTHDRLYLDRALRTAAAILARLTDGKGVLLDERDAWANGTFAGEWAREVLTLPGIPDAQRQLLRGTARAIYVRDRTRDGFYGGCWNGPADGPGSVWSTGGSRPQQIMTSANAANVIVAAAALHAAR